LPALPSKSAPAPPVEVVIYARDGANTTNPKWLVGKDKLAPEKQKVILDAVFGAGRYLADENGCGQRDEALGFGNEYLATARARGAFAPRVVQTASGSFTTPRIPQTVYLIQVGECGATHAENLGSELLAVFEGDTVVSRVKLDGGSSIDGVFDLDGDGWSEIVITTGFMSQGIIVASARLSRLQHDQILDVKSFGEVLHAACGTGLPGSEATSSLIRAIVRPGKPPEFTVEQKTGPCP
jgi:hypothetical protein